MRTASIEKHTVGNALVLHARERISPEAQSLALAVDEDADNDIVVLDLHDDLPVGIWESVAGALHRQRRGIRLVICGAGQDTTVLAGQWLSDRLGRPVIAPYGHMIRGAHGGLFVHAAEGSGWVRYSPGRPPAWEAKRYPTPAWDGAAADFLPTSAVGAVEPLPGGVWIRDTRDQPAIGDHWQRLAAALPCQPQALTIVLGCPGTPPLALDDVARFWRDLGEEGRSRARFVHYGPVQLPEGEPLGQALADLLEAPIVCFTGVPVGRPERPRIHTVTEDGDLGWQVFARELGYTPRVRSTMPARTPKILSYRAPLMLGDPAGPLIYRYAEDAVVEIIQSGLWIRGPVAPRHAERVRARAADPSLHAVVVEDTDPSRVVRLRELAEDLVARLDPPTRSRSAMQLATAVVRTGQRAQAAAGGVVADGSTFRFSKADLALDQIPTPPAAGIEVAAAGSLEVAVPAGLASDELESDRHAAPAVVLGAASRGKAGGSLAAAEPAVPERRVRDSPPSRPGPQQDRSVSVPLWDEASSDVVIPRFDPHPTRLPTRPSGSRSGQASSPGERVITPEVAVRVLEALDQAGGRPVAESVSRSASTVDGSGSVLLEDPPATDYVPAHAGPSRVGPSELTGRGSSDLGSSDLGRFGGAGSRPAELSFDPSDLGRSGSAPSSPALGYSGTVGLGPPLNPPAPTVPGQRDSGPSEPVRFESGKPEDGPAVLPLAATPRHLRFQTTPESDARGLPTPVGLAEERAWLRSTFSREYDAAASSVSRVLSEHPGFQAGPDTMVDAVAVRLYLSALGVGLDAALRDGAIGPQVPFARCVASGLGRLPSHRGATVLSAELSDADLREIRDRGVLTDWGFTSALTEPPPGLPGNVDILIWSMTARRTRLLEPDDDHRADGRVLFLPGTSFKVLDAAEPGSETRGHLLLRELSTDEPDRGHVPFDDLALSSLRRSVEQWARSTSQPALGPAATHRFTTVPGLY
ncbi:hypothetical protein [Actinoplanes friuliensis]|uniref:Uncharacterized protein n=1 Tax=Actinoplanes friuliensis DSM 7358 TaxID=1246995 RepID=U5VPB4_9ACTN|nr:hypothetical protein [Actinoplanes friuliensis]AGZ38808.1 hypothetical protein AFR_02595 [Actinoplanes friuliensis DSM 7358]